MVGRTLQYLYLRFLFCCIFLFLLCTTFSYCISPSIMELIIIMADLMYRSTSDISAYFDWFAPGVHTIRCVSFVKNKLPIRFLETVKRFSLIQIFRAIYRQTHCFHYFRNLRSHFVSSSQPFSTASLESEKLKNFVFRRFPINTDTIFIITIHKHKGFNSIHALLSKIVS